MNADAVLVGKFFLALTYVQEVLLDKSKHRELNGYDVEDF